MSHNYSDVIQLQFPITTHSTTVLKIQNDKLQQYIESNRAEEPEIALHVAAAEWLAEAGRHQAKERGSQRHMIITSIWVTSHGQIR